MRKIFYATMLLLFSTVPLSAGTLYFAQVADGGGYTTTFTIVNPTAGVATGTVSLRDGNGDPWSITLKDGRSGSQFSILVPAMGSTRLESTGSGEIKTGWASLFSQSDLSGVETFHYRSDSTLLDSVGVVGIPSGIRFVFPVDTSATSDSGFGIVNVGTGSAVIQLILKSENGNTYSSKIDSRLNPLATQKYLCLFASQIFPILQSGSFKGSLLIEVVGSGDIAVMGLSYREGQLASVPVVAVGAQAVLTSKQKAELLFGHWIFTYTIIGASTVEYTFASLTESTSEPGKWYAVGTDKYGKSLVATWSDTLNAYLSLEADDFLFQRVFIFDFTAPNAVSGSYYQYYNDGTISNPYPMTGIRTSTETGSQSYTGASRESQLESKDREFIEAEPLRHFAPTVSPVLLKEMEKLKNLR